MRDDYLSGVLASEKRNSDAPETAARDGLSARHPPAKGLAVPRGRDPDQG